AGWALLALVSRSTAEAGLAGPPILVAPIGFAVRLTGSFAILIGAAIVVHGYRPRYRPHVLTAPRIILPHLPASLGGRRIVRISDCRLGPLADRALLREEIARVNALAPDLVCVTGDIVDSRHTDLDAWLPELARLRARHGIYTILGNHDRHCGVERVLA